MQTHKQHHTHTYVHTGMNTYIHTLTYLPFPPTYPYLDTYIHTYLPTYIHRYIRTYVHAYIHTYIPTYLHTYIPTYLHTYIPTYLHTYIHTYIPTYLHTYIPTYLHTYIHTYIHTYVHTYMLPLHYTTVPSALHYRTLYIYTSYYRAAWSCKIMYIYVYLVALHDRRSASVHRSCRGTSPTAVPTKWELVVLEDCLAPGSLKRVGTSFLEGALFSPFLFRVIRGCTGYTRLLS